jgi:NADPH:quinone reductase-like Zn-dependent oxidoreductase
MNKSGLEMKAIRIHKHGGTEVLQIDEIDVPQVKKNEVLVKIHSAALNHLDLWVRKGIPGISLPIILGSDGAGIIEAIGSDIVKDEKIHIGDDVFLVPFRSNEPYGSAEELSDSYKILGEHIDGTQAEFVSVPVEFVMQKPKRLTWEQTSAFPLAYMTAYHMLAKKVLLKEGHYVLIWGASSGIGSAAIQIAKLYGTTVITTAGTEQKTEFAYNLGADYVINYNHEDVAKSVLAITNNKGVDIIFEHVGEKSWPHSLRSLKKGGKIIVCGSTTGPRVQMDLRHLYIKHQQIIGSTMGNRQDLSELSSLLDQGKIEPVVGHCLHVTEIKKAHEILDKNQQMGKIVINF